MKRLTATLFAATLLTVGFAANASAVPVLQLDIAGGTYDTETQTIVASSNPFTLYALATPQGNVTAGQIETGWFYLSAAVSPQVHTATDLGYITVNGQVVDVTSDMVYGTPPVEQFEELQGHDGQDLPQHDIYPTYFAEFAFQFSPTQKTVEYDTQERALNGGPGLTPSATGTSYYHEFVVDTSHLNPAFVIHFDLYNEEVKKCSKQDQQLIGPTCRDTDVARFAPFSHDAESSPPVPEPATIVLLGTGLAAAAARRFRRGRAS